MNHLHPDILKIIDSSDEYRINMIENSKWIGYPRAKKIMDKLDDLLRHPKTLRMPNLLIVGDTNNGKTILVNRFNTIHQPTIDEGDDKSNESFESLERSSTSSKRPKIQDSN